MATRRLQQPTPTHVLPRRRARRAVMRPAASPPPGVVPECPRGMDLESRRLWDQVLAELDEAGCLARCDGTRLARYVAMRVQWQRLVLFLRVHGETCAVRHTYRVPARRTADGTVIPRQTVTTTRPALRPEAQLALALAERLLRLEPQLGIRSASQVSLGRALTAARTVPTGYPLTLDPRRLLRLSQ